VHWGYEDPAAATGTDDERMAVFRRVFTQLGDRIQRFVALTERQPA
jgi:arsenate reductase